VFRLAMPLAIMLAWAVPAAAQDMTLDAAGVPTSGEWTELKIESEPGVVLAGSLYLPRGHGDGPFPLVIFLSGDGPNKRGGFHLLSERLLAKGIATFEYDKRGSGRSTGTFEPLLSEAATDGRAVFDRLRTHPAVDPDRVALAGLSEGAAVVPMIARDDPHVAAVVAFAGPAGPRATMFLGALAASLAGYGHDEAIAPLVAATETLMEAHARGAGDAEIAPLRERVIGGFESLGFPRDRAEQTYAVLDNPQTREMYQLDAQGNYQRIKAPVLILFGSLDDIVRQELNVEEAVTALRGNPDAAVLVVGGVNHWMIRAEDNLPRENQGWPVSAPEVLELVTSWLSARLTPG
jgi:uncharacterized protein